ncbi:MAG: alpha-2,8-polysialyltransferase family protein [Gammaproteobacteria bacterium]|nr:alpha-2,8-polysialyltransferase family protein [Gammaproteobacteria bacterium]
MNNVFLVKSPLQLINALEAKCYFNLKDNNCILIIMGDRKSYPQMLNLAKMSQQWHRVILMNNINILFGNPLDKSLSWHSDAIENSGSILRSSFFNILRLNRIAKYITDVDCIFFGDYSTEYMLHFVNIVPHNKTFLLDDGVGTVSIANRRMNMSGLQARQRLIKKIRITAKKLFLGLKNNVPDKIYYFTAYDIELNGKDELINNKYRYLKNMSQSLGVTDSIYFIGSPLSEVGIMSEKSYLEQLLMVKEFFKDFEVVYVAHRREAKEKLDKIKLNLNIDICHFEYPIEYQIAIVGPKPKIISSFITSALENLRIIMGDQVEIISFKLIKGTYSREKVVDDIYDYYNKNLSDYFYVESLY